MAEEWGALSLCAVRDLCVALRGESELLESYIAEVRAEVMEEGATPRLLYIIVKLLAQLRQPNQAAEEAFAELEQCFSESGEYWILVGQNHDARHEIWAANQAFGKAMQGLAEDDDFFADLMATFFKKWGEVAKELEEEKAALPRVAP